MLLPQCSLAKTNKALFIIYKKRKTMSEKNEKIIDVIRWLLLLPVSVILFVIGYRGGADIGEFIRKTFHLELPIVVFLPGILMVIGARLLVPKHKKLATWLAIILWLLVIIEISVLTYHVALEHQALYQTHLDAQQQQIP